MSDKLLFMGYLMDGSDIYLIFKDFLKIFLDFWNLIVVLFYNF